MLWYSKKIITIIITRTTENKPKVESQFNDFFFYESQWVGKLSILSIRASAGPPKAPPPGFGTFPLHHQMQVDNTENVSLKRPSMLTSAYIGSCRSGVPGVTQPMPQRLPADKFYCRRFTRCKLCVGVERWCTVAGSPDIRQKTVAMSRKREFPNAYSELALWY